MSREIETSLPQQLLDITKQMLNSGKPFSLTLSMENFNFSASSNTMEAPWNVVKKKKYKSPSQKNRDHIRKQNFLKHKLENPITKDNSEQPMMLSCDHCEHKNSKKQGLDTHVRMKHGTQHPTPQSEAFSGQTFSPSDQNVTCDNCGGKFSSKSMKVHKENEHCQHKADGALIREADRILSMLDEFL